MIDLWENISTKTLFLICPTDRIELLILQKIRSKAFFYTALGVDFEFDLDTQCDLRELIVKNRIKRIVFLSAINNVFYRKAFEQRGPYHYPVSRTLARIRKEIYPQRMPPGVFLPNFYGLAARHLAIQKKRLLSTKYLGYHLVEQEIAIEIYFYEPRAEVFYNLEEIEKKGQWLDNISFN